MKRLLYVLAAQDVVVLLYVLILVLYQAEVAVGCAPTSCTVIATGCSYPVVCP